MNTHNDQQKPVLVGFEETTELTDAWTLFWLDIRRAAAELREVRARRATASTTDNNTALETPSA